FPDVLQCRGEYQVRPPLPFTPGSEVAGRVVTIGPGGPPIETGGSGGSRPVRGAEFGARGGPPIETGGSGGSRPVRGAEFGARGGPPIETGQRVVALAGPPHGALAEQVPVAASSAFPIPDSLSGAKATALPVNYHTTWYALHARAHLQAGETLLVHAGAGG